MKNATTSTINRQASAKMSLHQELLELYWAKKELDCYLPGISKYATPEELCTITLTQLSSMENRILKLLQEISASENSQCD